MSDTTIRTGGTTPGVHKVQRYTIHGLLLLSLAATASAHFSFRNFAAVTT